jgi:hypothetical protein
MHLYIDKACLLKKDINYEGFQNIEFFCGVLKLTAVTFKGGLRR